MDSAGTVRQILKMKAFSILMVLMTSAAFAQRPLVLEGGTLNDCTGAAPVQNSVIVIRGAKIVSVGTLRDTPLPADAQVIDARGKYIIPGLIDCHIHYGTPGDLVQLLAW